MASEQLLGRLVNGKYAVQRVIAAGGMGKIYCAEQQPLGRIVALKVLHPRAASAIHGHDGGSASGTDPAFQKRFFREASILAKLQHPNIVTVFDYGRIEGLPEDDEQFFMAMEFLQGETLGQRLAKRGRLAPEEVMRVARQVGRGLAEAHAHGIVHRDLKPSNLMLVSGRDGEDLVKILDFGIVKLTGEDETTQELTQEGSFIGSPKYMAPEQIANGKVDPRTDLYSLGIILYQALTGRLPFDAESSIQIMMAHVNQLAPPMRERAPDAPVPELLEAAVMRCLEKDPERRPATVEELLRLLAEIGGTTSSTSLASVRSPSSPLGLSSSHPALIGSVPPGSTGSGARPGRLSSTGTGALTSGDTQASHLVAAGDAPAPRDRSRLPLLVAVGAALFFGGVALVALRQPPRRADALDVAPPTASAGGRKTFVLFVESTPAGAEVWDGDHVLGATPLQIPIANDAVRATPRSLALRRPGYLPYAVVQGPSEDNVRTAVTLIAAADPEAGAAPPSTAHGSPRPSPRRPPPGSEKPPSTPPQPDLDIRMKR